MTRKIFHTVALVGKKSVSDKEVGLVNNVVGSSACVDRMGDSIDQNGWVLKNFKKNPVILWGHNVREEKPPIGKAIKVWIDGAGKKARLMFNVKFDMQDKFAAEVYRKIKDGFLNTVSVGFAPMESEPMELENPFGGRVFLAQELLELSFVPVPANPEAVVALKNMGLEPKEISELYPQKAKKTKKVIKEVAKGIKKTVTKNNTSKKKVEKGEAKKVVKKVKAVKKVKKTKVKTEVKVEEKKKVAKKIEEKKGVVKFKDLGVAPESDSWDGIGEIAKADVAGLKIMSTWFDEKRVDEKASYKLPHHRFSDKKAVWRGVAAAMASLLGARGGVEIPEDEKKKVFNHLVKHYKQFDKRAPRFRMIEEQILANLDEEVHALILDREDKHVVRLVKKVLRETKKTVSKKEPGLDLVKALRVLDKATSLLTDSSHLKGGVK